ncbi:MAG: tRNA 4-thiouridine(8) synthase ThiI [Lachnospiraceae bacterium]|nr:tRNA 4-thiouridine(8) synthase ThiI [Lachnospiraceae bacterium]
MFDTFLIKYGEIAIKGKNRHLFEEALVKQIRHALSKIDGEFSVMREQGRIYVDCGGDFDYDETVDALGRVFGIVGICPVMKVEDKGLEKLGDDVIRFLEKTLEIAPVLKTSSAQKPASGQAVSPEQKSASVQPVGTVQAQNKDAFSGTADTVFSVSNSADGAGSDHADGASLADDPGAEHITFKVMTRRAKKSYSVPSMDVNSELGGRILEAFPQLRVDVHDPEITLHVEIRDMIYIYSKIIPGPGGMPVGTSGRAMLLLSGGIDSPVAGYMIGKRGVVIDAVYFHAPPYTSERAKEKVVDLAKIVAKYTGPIRLHVVNFTDIQLYIYEKCPHDELTIIMRRYMMRIAERFAAADGSMALVTGESIGQVASQTMQSLAVTNEVCSMPVFRPLIGFDKQEIVEMAKKIDTFETSILPFEDCCTIFVAKHPVTKPNLKVIQRSELKLAEKIDEMVETAVATAEIFHVE